MSRVVSVAALALALSVVGVGARAEWRHGDDDWRWRHHHPRHYRPAPEVIMVYPAPPPVIYAPSPRVVYVEPPPPVQVTPTSPPYNDAAGRYCREYQTTLMVAGQPQPSFGTACLMPDGQWRIVE